MAGKGKQSGKGLIERAVDAFDHAIHSDGAPVDQTEASVVEPQVEAASEPTGEEQGDQPLEGHAKFAKFKTETEEK